jgi:hypothetical protein
VLFAVWRACVRVTAVYKHCASLTIAQMSFCHTKRRRFDQVFGIHCRSGTFIVRDNERHILFYRVSAFYSDMYCRSPKTLCGTNAAVYVLEIHLLLLLYLLIEFSKIFN